ncbi:uracil-DNA glycosylase [Candidatus Gracilibacteria bacterium GN02-872]|nr:uracil-DNA glycosylase [Candidatus Gracilibacteria bacterium GN02-872]
MNINIEASWLEILKDEFEKDYMKEIKSFLVKEIESGKTIYPHPKNIFKAFDKTPFDKVKVVILGQDPYHGPNQAQGFCFSVKNGTKLPPSLQNIYKELERSLGIKPSLNGDLTIWSEQGVFLLNAILTVEGGKPASHSQIGWEKFTDEVIKQISEKKENVVFLLWGAFAQSKEKLIDEKKHFILKTTHPSPFSAHRGFIGSDCFKKTNEILEKIGKKPINWEIKS